MKDKKPVILIIEDETSLLDSYAEILKETFSCGADGYLMKTELEPDQIIEEINTALKTDSSKRLSV